jgi:hypothetical protein
MDTCMATNTTSLTSTASDTDNVTKTRALAIAAGLVANVVYFLVVTQAAGHQILTPLGDPPEPLQIGPVIGASVIAPLVGWGLLAILERVTPSRAALIWGVIAVVVLVVGLPFAAPTISGTDKLLLAVMHLIVGAAVIPAFVITSRRRA